jgi:hypothetical protein
LHEGFPVNTVTTAGLREAFVDSQAELLKLNRAKFVTVLHQAKRLPNNLAGRVVEAGLNLGVTSCSSSGVR